MAVTGTETVRDLITDALLEIEALTLGQAIPADQAAHALRMLNRLMKGWQVLDGAPDFLRATQSVTATTSAAHTLNPVRPLRILSVNRVATDGNETPLREISRDEYKDMPDKDATGTPTLFYYDRQKESAVMYVWPVYSAVTTETFNVDYEREFTDIASLGDTIDLPAEWYEAAILQLASRLAPAYGSENAKTRTFIEAERALNRALGAGMSGESVFLGAASA